MVAIAKRYPQSVADVHDTAEIEEIRGSWLVRALYLGLIGANLYLVFDWWAGTPEGQAALGRLRTRWEAAKKKAEECEGCARRRALMGRAFESAKNRMHWQAERIVEGEDVETQPEDSA